jgi:CO/xanthine dehydrogenase FAD-binding subunit
VLAPFEIHQPRGASEASALRARHGDAAAVYAGGSELLLVMKEGLGRYEHLIDVKTIPELHELRHDAARRMLVVGAAVTHRELERSALVRGRSVDWFAVHRGGSAAKWRGHPRPLCYNPARPDTVRLS